MAETRNIDYEMLFDNVKTMINLLEYDSMRSSGKCKLNSQHLHSLYFLKGIYEEKCCPPKRGPGRPPKTTE